jgi:hypothetical protein
LENIFTGILRFLVHGQVLAVMWFVILVLLIFSLLERLKTHAFNRLLSARAGGQFKPLPRKGVTVGFHWLLPKPFGNDFRQEPWMVHATDNMVYVPKDKITDISAEEVLAGDWRDKVVPSPVGNDMLYMQ